MKLTMKLALILVSLIACSFSQTGNVYEKIKTLYKSGKPQEAIELATTELKKPNITGELFKKIIRLRANYYMELRNFSPAIEDWKTLIKLYPKDESLYENLAYTYWESGDMINCISCIDYAYSIAPKNAGVLSNMAYYYSLVGKYEDSVDYATTGLKQNNIENNLKAMLFNNRGYAYLRLKQANKALADINKAISLDPDNSFAYCYRALTNIELGKMETVCVDLERSKSLGAVKLTKDLILEYCNN